MIKRPDNIPPRKPKPAQQKDPHRAAVAAQKQVRKAEVRKKVNTLGRRVATAVNALGFNGQIKTLFDTAVRFNRFSPSNKILLTRAMPDATYVARREEWEQMGRTIKADAKPIILGAPETYTGANGMTGVRMVDTEYFDISQTDGRDLTFGLEPPIYREDLLIAGMREVLAQAGIQLRFTGIKKYAGEFKTKPAEGGRRVKVITVKHDLEPQEMVRTLLHETAHAEMHQDRVPHEIAGQVEIEAEAVAYIASSYFGVADDLHSMRYIDFFLAGGRFRDHVPAAAADSEHCRLDCVPA